MSEPPRRPRIILWDRPRLPKTTFWITRGPLRHLFSDRPKAPGHLFGPTTQSLPRHPFQTFRAIFLDPQFFQPRVEGIGGAVLREPTLPVKKEPVRLKPTWKFSRISLRSPTSLKQYHDFEVIDSKTYPLPPPSIPPMMTMHIT